MNDKSVNIDRIENQQSENNPLAQPDARPEQDSVIWDRFRKGSTSALTLIYKNHVHDLYAYGCRLTTNHELVKDTIHELFTYLIEHKGRLSPTTSIKFYLYRSLKNNLIRAMAREKSAEAHVREEGFQISFSPEEILINQQVENDKRRMIEHTLNALPVQQKEAVLLYFYDGMKYDQISKVLGIKIKSSRALIYRAIDSLKKALTP